MVIKKYDGFVVKQTDEFGNELYLQMNCNGDWAFVNDLREAYIFDTLQDAKVYLLQNDLDDTIKVRYKILKINATFTYELE
jgi:hypothetical protein